ncbi:hypothetical protein MCOR02_002865 [Pyricularia oryzae]|nr:hypothetical protein MCOR02_002865 [Pyricularia oryzae]
MGRMLLLLPVGGRKLVAKYSTYDMQADPRASSAAEEPPFRGALHRLFSGKQPSVSSESEVQPTSRHARFAG